MEQPDKKIISIKEFIAKVNQKERGYGYVSKIEFDKYKDGDYLGRINYVDYYLNDYGTEN